MAEYDHLVKALIERYAGHIAGFIRGVGVAVKPIEKQDKESVTVRRYSDALFQIKENGYEYLMLVEFQARPDRKMDKRLMEYTAIHHRRYEKPVYPVVVNLTGGSGEVRYKYDCLDLTVMDFNYRRINLREIRGGEYMSRGFVGLIPFVPLMKHDDPPEEVLEMCARRIENESSTEEERNTLYLCLGVLSSLKYPKELILKVLEVSKMENSPLFDGIREKWLDQGMQQGMHEGLQQGLIEAIAEALEENTERSVDGLANRLRAIKDVSLLKKLLRRAVKVKDLDEFLVALGDIEGEKN